MCPGGADGEEDAPLRSSECRHEGEPLSSPDDGAGLTAEHPRCGSLAQGANEHHLTDSLTNMFQMVSMSSWQADEERILETVGGIDPDALEPQDRRVTQATSNSSL